MMKVMLFDDKWGEVVIEVTLGVAEAMAMISEASPKSILTRLAKYTNPPQAIYDPKIFMKALPILAEIIDKEFKRLPPPPRASFGGKPPIRSPFSSIKYALANKTHLPPLEAESRPIEEIIDYLALMVEEAREFERVKRKIRK